MTPIPQEPPPTSPDDRLIALTAQHVRQLMEGDSSGHDWWHIWRVWQTVRRLASAENADVTVCELAALLHDIADWKFHDGDETAGPREAARWLDQIGAAAALRDHVCEIIAEVTYKGSGVATPTRSREGAVVQDADRLDAIGAIGIARAFAYGGAKGRVLYEPAIAAEQHASFAAYHRNSGPTLNHFYEKLLLLKDRMQTATGRSIAVERHQYLEQFLAQFLAEWAGEA
ncbi:MAG: HD domain-containing protein [Pirellulales bacterium]